MFHARHRVKLLFLIIPMILASCDLLGVAVEDELTSIVTTDEQTPADQPDIQATVEEQVQATLQAQAALAPELSTPTTVPAKTAEPQQRLALLQKQPFHRTRRQQCDRRQ